MRELVPDWGDRSHSKNKRITAGSSIVKMKFDDGFSVRSIVEIIFVSRATGFPVRAVGVLVSTVGSLDAIAKLIPMS